MRLSWVRPTLAALVLIVDAVALGVWWHLVPSLRRPGDWLLVMLIALGIATTAAVRNRTAQAAGLVAAALGFSLGALELAQRQFDIVFLFSRARQPAADSSGPDGGASPYNFQANDIDGWRRAKENALRDGARPEEIGSALAGDIFAGVPAGELRVHEVDYGSHLRFTVSRAAGTQSSSASPLGRELAPDRLWRDYATAAGDGLVLWDGRFSTTSFGARFTPGDDAGGEVYVFMGCSFMYGSYLSDGETVASRFSECFGYKKRVINTGFPGSGPHYALRDLELNLHLGRAGVKPADVKGVYYGYIPHHATRVLLNWPDEAPRYALENGVAVYKGQFGRDDGASGRLRAFLTKTRLYPAILNRLGADMDLTLAILVRMHALCRERYNVPLQVVDWSPDGAFAERMREAGIVVHRVDDIFGPGWRQWQVKYYLADGHPSANANRLIARHLHEAAQGTAGL